MENLNLVSFVGIDNHTNLKDIVDFQDSCPIPCEWGVLYSDSKSQTKHVRYPDYKFCKDFLDFAYYNRLYSSLHLCGSVIERYLNKDSDVMELCEKAHRIQLNLNINDYPDHLKLSERLWSVLKYTGHSIILQQNKTKEKFMKIFLEDNIFPISILHDGSGGFGREITKISPPFEKYFTGYAGGINPENVSKIVKLIEDNNDKNLLYYIDMESGVRENNLFSINKCKQIIENLTKK